MECDGIVWDVSVGLFADSFVCVSFISLFVSVFFCVGRPVAGRTIVYFVCFAWRVVEVTEMATGFGMLLYNGVVDLTFEMATVMFGV